MKLYKYKSSSTIERDFPFLENNEIWFSKVDTLNDPYEGTFFIGEENKIAFNLLFPKRKIAFENLYQARTNLANIQNKIAGVLSLTKEKNNLLMWSHYSENHKGYILEYDFDESCFEPVGEHAKYRPDLSLIKVEYTSRPKKQSIGHKVKFIQLYNKSKCWEYEKEYRFISSIYGKYKYKSDCLKAIYLGANISIENESKFHRFCTNNNITLFKAKIPSKKFELEFENIFLKKNFR